MQNVQSRAALLEMKNRTYREMKYHGARFKIASDQYSDFGGNFKNAMRG
ncbi:MAG: hypothetical protein ACLR78_04410 [Roseburia sp.]